MRKTGGASRDGSMREEHDFSGGERGKYAKRFSRGSTLVALDSDVAKVFPTSDSVNEALRALADLARRQVAAARK